MDNIGEVIHVQVVERSAGSVCDAEQIESIEFGSVSSVGMVVDYVEQNQNVEGGSEVMSVDDVERVRIVEEGILAMNDVGDAERVRFIVEDDLRSGETDDENETHVNEAVTTPKASLVIHKETPGVSVYWQPNMEPELIPEEGAYFDTLDDAIRMYKAYALRGGFEIKLSSQRKTRSGFVQHKYLLCNREGKLKNINIDTLKRKGNDKPIRNRNLRVTGCMARVKLDLDPVSGKYKLVKFNPRHNHTLCPDVYRHLSKTERKMVYSEKLFVMKAKTANIGATVAHHIYSSMKGYDLVHGQVVYFKNYFRELNCFIGEGDSQMLINKMENRKTYVPNFSFHYKVEDSELVALFWADEVMKCNYEEFGDIVSFDATFRTNKYNMVFVPFTAIDNHRKSVTIAAGMLKSEDTKSYIWLLESFMTAFNKQPTMVVTDQDGAMKKAIAAVLPESKHRLCMWHITQKVPHKICKKIYDETDFKRRFNQIVWDMFLEPREFEEKWGKLIEDFGLKDHKWMTKMFNMRSAWIPAYFLDSPLFGLMRTTSRSESENSFFSHFTNEGSTLINFMICFESAMEKQRHIQEQLDFDSMDSMPKLKTKLNVQTEEGCEITLIRDKNAGEYRTLYKEKKKGKSEQVEKPKAARVQAMYKVVRNLEDGSVVCTCRHFLRFGFPCRHIFCVFKNNDIEKIPERYILRRWTRDIIPPDLRRKRNRYGEKNETNDRLTNEATCLVDDCLHRLSNDEAKMAEFVEQIRTLKKKVDIDVPNPPSKKDDMEKFIGVPKPKIIGVKNPSGAKNKGGTRAVRRKSEREKAIDASLKPKRKCGECGVRTNTHTKKTFPLGPKAIAAAKAMNNTASN